MVAVVGRLGKLDRPARVGLPSGDELLDLAVTGQKTVIAAAFDDLGEIELVGAEVEAAQVPVGYLDRPPPGPVGRHGRDREVGSLDLGDQKPAAGRAERIRVGLGAAKRDLASFDQRPGI